MATEEPRGSHAPRSGTTPVEPPVAGTNPPGVEEIRNHVERIVGSLGFLHSESLVRLLQAVTSETLAGRGGDLKEYVLGAEVLGRGPDFDPKADPIVRMQMGRLRAKLERYYQAEGRQDRVIVEIPKGAYVPVFRERESGPANLAAAGSMPRPRRGAKGGFLIAAGMVALAGFGVWLMARYLSPASEPHLWESLPLTSYPGVERNPALSPDETRVAFSWNGENEDNFDIYVKPLDAGEPLRLTTDPAEDLSPAWSPDGRRLAFLRYFESRRVALFVIPALGGPEHRVAEARTGERRVPLLAWSPDGRWLVTSHREPEEAPEGLFLISVETGEKRRLTTAPPTFAGDFTPAFSPDGRRLAFCRLASISNSEVLVLPLSEQFEAAGEPRSLSETDRWVASPVWTRDGHQIVYASAPRPDTHHELRIASVSGSPRIERIQTVEDATELSLGRHLVYAARVLGINIWRAEIRPSGAPLAEPHRFLSSTRLDDAPRYSPDGKWIAFESDRSGSEEIWIAKSDGSNPVRLTSFGGPLVGVLDWSPDGQQLVFHARPDGPPKLFTIPVTGGQPRRLTTHPSDGALPSYSRDGRWIYFTSGRSGRFAIWRMPAQGGNAEQITPADNGGVMPLESPDRKHIYYCHDNPEKGVWKVPVGGGEARQVTGPLSERWCGLAVTEDGIYYTAAPDAANRYSIQFLSFATGRSRPVVVSDRPIGTLGLTVSPDQRFVVFLQREHSGSDLMLIRDFTVR